MFRHISELIPEALEHIKRGNGPVPGGIQVDPTTLTKEEIFKELDGQGIPRYDYPSRDYGLAKRYLFSCFVAGWVPRDEDYKRLIDWISEYVGL